MTQTQTITARSTDFTSSTNFNLFNPSLGTLTEVDWTVAISGNVNGTVTNNAPSAQDFTTNETTTFKTTSPGIGTINASSLATPEDYTGLDSGASSTFGPFTPSTSANTSITGSGLNGYIGSGTFNFGLKPLTGTTILGGGGNVSANISTSAGATTTLTYVYTGAAAPEPGSRFSRCPLSRRWD